MDREIQKTKLKRLQTKYDSFYIRDIKIRTGKSNTSLYNFVKMKVKKYMNKHVDLLVADLTLHWKDSFKYTPLDTITWFLVLEKEYKRNRYSKIGYIANNGIIHSINSHPDYKKITYTTPLIEEVVVKVKKKVKLEKYVINDKDENQELIDKVKDLEKRKLEKEKELAKYKYSTYVLNLHLKWYDDYIAHLYRYYKYQDYFTYYVELEYDVLQIQDKVVGHIEMPKYKSKIVIKSLTVEQKLKIEKQNKKEYLKHISPTKKNLDEKNSKILKQIEKAKKEKDKILLFAKGFDENSFRRIKKVNN